MSNLLELTEVEFLTYLCLHRLPADSDPWRSLPLRAAKAALRFNEEFYAFNSLNINTIHKSLDLKHEFDEAVLDRAYRVMLDRPARADEVDRWRRLGRLSLNQLVWEGFFSDEALGHDGFTISDDRRSAGRGGYAGIQKAVNTMNFDLFIAHQQRTIAPPTKATALPTDRPVTVGLSFFVMSEHDLSATKAILSAVFSLSGPFEFRWVAADQIIDDDVLSQLDIFVTYNNGLYHRQPELLTKIAEASCFTCCWLWDNHHQFALTTLACNTFDLCLPAHSNGQTYLHGGTALIGPVLPCCTFQWRGEQIPPLQAIVAETRRCNTLFGRFNTYGGRVSSRDAFIAAASDSAIETDLVIIPESENKWYLETPEERYENLARHKVVLCTPVFNDLPARVFDALVAGCIPVVPHGLPDLGQSFTETEIADGVVVTHRPNDVASLERAVARGIAAFDRAGPSGVARRQRIAAERHLLPMRLARIVAESVAAMKV